MVQHVKIHKDTTFLWINIYPPILIFINIWIHLAKHCTPQKSMHHVSQRDAYCRMNSINISNFGAKVGFYTFGAKYLVQKIVIIS